MPKHALRMTAVALLAVTMAACGEDVPDGVPSSSDAPSPLVRVGPDSRSEPFTSPGPWHVSVTADGYCAVTVFTEPDGEPVNARWSLDGFTIRLDNGGRYSIGTSGCVSAEAVTD